MHEYQQLSLDKWTNIMACLCSTLINKTEHIISKFNGDKTKSSYMQYIKKQIIQMKETGKYIEIKTF